jgi:hypothetical protein
MVQRLVIHHMGDGKPPEVPISQRWNPYGYQYPEYDFGIEYNGTIVQGRPLNAIGAHCIADKPQYNYGKNWWNQNSLGIGLAGDFTKYPMTQAQFDSLVLLVKKLMAQHNLTLDDVYPHGQVTYTDCPGCVYDRVPALHGGWNYNAFMAAVLNDSSNAFMSVVLNNSSVEKEEPMIENLIVYIGSPEADIVPRLQAHLKAPAVMLQDLTVETAKAARKVYGVGYSPEKYVVGNYTIPLHQLITGNDATDTALAVINFIKGQVK